MWDNSSFSNSKLCCHFISSIVYWRASHALGGMTQTLNFRVILCFISPRVDHNEKAFNPAVSFGTPSFPRVNSEFSFFHCIVTKLSCHHYKVSIFYVKLNWCLLKANEIFSSKKKKTYKTVQVNPVHVSEKMSKPISTISDFFHC